jgi:hypothetical protein
VVDYSHGVRKSEPVNRNTVLFVATIFFYDVILRKENRESYTVRDFRGISAIIVSREGHSSLGTSKLI